METALVLTFAAGGIAAFIVAIFYAQDRLWPWRSDWEGRYFPAALALANAILLFSAMWEALA